MRVFFYGLAVVFGLVFTAAVFGAGVMLGGAMDFGGAMGFGSKIVAPVSDPDFMQALREVEAILDREALRPASDESKTIGAVKGLLEGTGDEYALYFDERHFGFFNEQSDGEFFGIGVNIGQRDSSVYVVSVIEDTPAQRAGIRADDVFVKIDDVERDEWTTEEVVRRVRGPEGTKVEVTVFRPSEKKNVEFTIERARINIPNIETAREGDVGYVRLMSFNHKSADELRDAIKKLQSEGAKGIVLDLRDNSGGLLQSSIDVASLFIAEGEIVSIEGRAGIEDVYNATGRNYFDLPLVVLMNRNSASASEVLGGALQDHERAQLVGEQSFGKGSVQGVREVSFGGAIKFTTAHYLTPDGREINGVGLTPDVVVEMEPEAQADEATDVQRKRAFELVREQF